MWKALTQVQYRLLETPEYIGPLRQEVEAVVAEEGWTKAGIDKMHKLDGFIRRRRRPAELGCEAFLTNSHVLTVRRRHRILVSACGSPPFGR